MKILVYIMAGLLLLSGCAVHELDPQSYVGWMKDESNGLRVSKQIGDCSFTLQYKTDEFEGLIRSHNPQIRKAALDSIVQPLSSLQFYTLTVRLVDGKELAAENTSEEAEYGSKINYMISDMQLDFSLVDGKDTLPCAFYHYERNFSVSPDNNILLGFEKPAVEKNMINDKTLIYNDRLLGNGLVLLTIKGDAIRQIPKLKLAE